MTTNTIGASVEAEHTSQGVRYVQTNFQFCSNNIQYTMQPVDIWEDCNVTEKEFIEDIESMVSEVANYEDNSLNFKCFYCSKLCKSKRGLSRHVNVKHAALKEGSYVSTVDNPLSEEIHSKLKDILEACAEKISGDLCFPEDFRSNFCKENFSISDENTESLAKHKTCCGRIQWRC